MRQGQQNRRGRGRGGRKGQNPLSRSFESSGPDIKIRGTAQHIAEKYMALARDAIGSGDLVLGENYLQHAEHYNRIIMAAQTQPQNSFGDTNANGQRIARPEGDISDSEGYDGDDDGSDGDQPNGGFDQPRAFEANNNGGQQRDYQGNQGNQGHQGGNQGNQPRYRDNRNYEHRNNNTYDNRHNQQRYDQRSQGGQGGQGGQDHQRNSGYRNPDQRRHEPREQYEPRFQDQDRMGNGNNNAPMNVQPSPANAEQPHTFEPPAPPQQPPVMETPAAGFEPRPQADGPNPRRRRRPRHENGTTRAYPPQAGDEAGSAGGEPPQPMVNHDAGSSGNGNGSDGQP